VSAGLEDRKDEVAVLARDFDAMADQLRANRAAITQLLRDISHELRSPLARMRVAVGWRASRRRRCARQLDRLEREIERLDGSSARCSSWRACTARMRPSNGSLRSGRSHRGSGARCELRRAVKGLPVLLSGRGARAATRQSRTAAQRHRERAAQRRALQPAGRAGGGVGRAGGPGTGVSIVIRDRGPGVPSADLERIFEPFYRVAESRDRDSGGEGIGLAITSQVMKAHGGSARASNPGRRLEVRLSLPDAPWLRVW
jgi:signal transduction histidine kinase